MITALIQHLWQSTLFGLFACLLILLYRNGSSWSRHLIAWVALLKFLIPLSLFQGILPYSLQWSSVFQILPFSQGQPKESVASAEDIVIPTLDLPAGVNTPEVPWTSLLIFAWTSGFLILFTRRCTQYLRSKRSIATNSHPAHEGWQKLARFILGTHELTPPKIVISSDRELHAGVFGLVNTTIVIPEKIDRAFDPCDRETFLRHELQHVIKKDNLWLFAQKCIRDLLWFHPLAYWLDRQISSEREIMRDEEVLQQTKNITSYLNCLMKASNIELPSSYATSVGLKGSPFTRRLKAITNYKSSLFRKIVSGTTSIIAITAMVALFTVSTNSIHANDDDREDQPSVKHLLRKHLELQEEMEKAKSSLNKTANEYERTYGQLRRALLSDDFDEDLSPDEAELADRFLARLEEHMAKQDRREKDRNREIDDKSTHDGDGYPREKAQMMENHLEEVNGRLQWLDEQAEDRDLTENEAAQLKELKMAKEHLLKSLDEYRDRRAQDNRDI